MGGRELTAAATKYWVADFLGGAGKPQSAIHYQELVSDYLLFSQRQKQNKEKEGQQLYHDPSEDSDLLEKKKEYSDNRMTQKNLIFLIVMVWYL